jgi:response regulator RpfG family c-di-GMP phosphodiesterase
VVVPRRSSTLAGAVACPRSSSAAGTPVALVIGGVGAQDPDGIEVLAGIRAIDPTASRVAAVCWGEFDAARSLFDAVALGAIDHWVMLPVQTPDEDFHRAISGFLSEWGQPARRRLRGGVGDRRAMVRAVTGTAGWLLQERDPDRLL